MINKIAGTAVLSGVVLFSGCKTNDERIGDKLMEAAMTDEKIHGQYINGFSLTLKKYFEVQKNGKMSDEFMDNFGRAMIRQVEYVALKNVEREGKVKRPSPTDKEVFTYTEQAPRKLEKTENKGLIDTLVDVYSRVATAQTKGLDWETFEGRQKALHILDIADETAKKHGVSNSKSKSAREKIVNEWVAEFAKLEGIVLEDVQKKEVSEKECKKLGEAKCETKTKEIEAKKYKKLKDKKPYKKAGNGKYVKKTHFQIDTIKTPWMADTANMNKLEYKVLEAMPLIGEDNAQMTKMLKAARKFNMWRMNDWSYNALGTRPSPSVPVYAIESAFATNSVKGGNESFNAEFWFYNNSSRARALKGRDIVLLDKNNNIIARNSKSISVLPKPLKWYQDKQKNILKEKQCMVKVPVNGADVPKMPQGKDCVEKVAFKFSGVLDAVGIISSKDGKTDCSNATKVDDKCILIAKKYVVLD